MQELTSLAFFFGTSISDSGLGVTLCFKPSKRPFIGCVCVGGGITVSAKWSSFFTTGVPDWHKKTNETVSHAKITLRPNLVHAWPSVRPNTVQILV